MAQVRDIRAIVRERALSSSGPFTLSAPNPDVSAYTHAYVSATPFAAIAIPISRFRIVTRSLPGAQVLLEDVCKRPYIGKRAPAAGRRKSREYGNREPHVPQWPEKNPGKEALMWLNHA